MPHATKQNVKECTVRDGGWAQLQGTTKEVLCRRHTELVQHDITRGSTPHTGLCDMEES